MDATSESPTNGQLSERARDVLRDLIAEGKGDWGAWRLGMAIEKRTGTEFELTVIAEAVRELRGVTA